MSRHFHILVLDKYVSGEKIRTFLVRSREHADLEMDREQALGRSPQYRECDDKCLGPEFTQPWAPPS